MLLPKVYEDRGGKNPQLKGKPKLSYSQYTSYKDPEYQDDYYVQYFSGVSLPSGEFAEMGSSVGECIEHIAKGQVVNGCLSQEDVKIIKETVDFPENCIYEDPIALDLGEVVIEGYIDRTWHKKDKDIEIRDYKTLNVANKSKFYASEEYAQTSLYAYYKELQGFKIVNSEVFGLGRKGSSLSGTGNFKMRLSGETVIIPTPYTRERGEKIAADIKKTAEQISEDYSIYLKYFG